MNIRHGNLVVLSLATGALLVLATGVLAEPEPQANRQDTQIMDSPPIPPQAPYGYVLVEEGLWSQYAGEPDREFRDAQSSFDDNDMPSAADAILAGASYVRAEASRSDPVYRDDLKQASDELVALAAKIRSGQITDVSRLVPVFARAHHVLAEHHLLLASQAETAADTEHTALHLRAAAENLRAQLAWETTAPDRQAVAILDRAVAEAKRLQTSGQAPDAQTHQVLADCQRVLGESPPPAPAAP